MTLEQIAQLLDAAPRRGHAPDRDRPGRPKAPPPVVATADGRVASSDRYISISDALAREIAETLRQHARGESPRAVALERR